MGDHYFPAGDLPRLRRGAHEFLRHRAALAWAHQHGGDRWEITLPPDVAALPERQRYRTHARQEARRLATAQLYDLDPETTASALCLGAALYQGARDEAVARVGRPGAVATMSARPPAETGFVRWQDGIGCNALGAPVVACHWGPWGPPGNGGRWLAWWADSHAMATAYAVQARSGGVRLDPGLLTREFGPLWYDHQDLLLPARASAPDEAGLPGPGTADTPPGDEAGTPGLMLLHITLATWHLLTGADGVQLTRNPAPAAEQDADHAAGLRPCLAVITATGGTA